MHTSTLGGHVISLEPWHVAGLLAVVMIGVAAAYLSGRRRSRNSTDGGERVKATDSASRERAARRDEEVSRLTPRSQARVGAGSSVALSDADVRARALDLAGQIRSLASEPGEPYEHDAARAPVDGVAGERRAPERLGEVRHERAKTLYQRVRHEAIDVRTAMLARLAGRALPARKPGIDHMYDYQASAESFRDIADDLEQLAAALGK